MATNFTKVDIEQLKTLANNLKTNSTNIYSSISTYNNNLGEIEKSNYLQGVAESAITLSCEKIRKICEEFKEFAENLSTKINDMANETEEIDKTEGQKEQEIFESNPLNFGNSGDSKNNNTGGTTIDIPDGLGNVHTYMGWSKITNKTTAQYKLRQDAGEHYDSEGFAKIDGRYVIACTDTYGKIGDYVDFYQEDGTVIHGVIGDYKDQSDAGCNKWGHNGGNVVVEYIVDTDTWYSSGRGGSADTMHENPGSPSCHPELNQDITHAVNVGSYYD